MFGVEIKLCKIKKKSEENVAKKSKTKEFGYIWCK